MAVLITWTQVDGANPALAPLDGSAVGGNEGIHVDIVQLGKD